MADLPSVKGATYYPCPMCSTPVASEAHWCGNCGTDLTRAGAMITSSGQTARPARARMPRVLRAGLVVVLGLALALAAAYYQSGALGLSKGNLWNQLRRQTQRPPATPHISTRKPVVAPAPAARPAPAVPATIKTTPPPTPTVAAPTLSIASTPRGALVQIDGRARGATPLRISNLKAGPHSIRISLQGYRPAAKAVTLQPGATTQVAITLRRSETVQQNAPPRKTAASPQKGGLLTIGQAAPQFAAKDRVGILYRLSDLRGGKVLIVFVQTLDATAQRVIREANSLQAARRVDSAVAIVIKPDRVAIREFTSAGQIQIPVLFGTPAIATAYGVDGRLPALYLLGADGRISRRQAGRIDPMAMVR